MKIILEGCDGTGKTTLAKKLVQHYGLDYVHVNRDDPTTYEFYSQTMKKTNVIWDRHFIGEMVYPSVFKRKPNLKMVDFENLLQQSKENKIIILVLTAGEDRLAETNKRDEFPEVLKNLYLINGQFIAIADIYKIPMINVFETSFEDIIKVIEKGGNIV